jgi:hypothetical protein
MFFWPHSPDGPGHIKKSRKGGSAWWFDRFSSPTTATMVGHMIADLVHEKDLLLPLEGKRWWQVLHCWCRIFFMATPRQINYQLGGTHSSHVYGKHQQLDRISSINLSKSRVSPPQQLVYCCHSRWCMYASFCSMSFMSKQWARGRWLGLTTFYLYTHYICCLARAAIMHMNTRLSIPTMKDLLEN